MCGKFIGDFSINFCGKFTEDVFNFRCIIFYIKIIDDSSNTCREFIRDLLFRFPYMVTILTNIAGLTNKKTAVKVKKGMTPEELSNDKLDMIR